jgi:hypothetical protein
MLSPHIPPPDPYGAAFGLRVSSDVPLPGHWRADGAGLPGVTIERATVDAVRAAWSGAAALGWMGRTDGRDLRVEHGHAGDLRLELDSTVELHVSADGGRVLVADSGEAPLLLARLLLDSALFTVSLHQGWEAVHAGAVLTPAGAIAVMGSTGAGKSSLTAALVAAGCGFFTDDVLVLGRGAESIAAHPGPPVMTVPRGPAAAIGDPVGELGDEVWLAMTGSDGARPLAGIVHLDSATPEVATSALSWREILVHCLRFPRTRDREQARFELAADVALSAKALRLAAHREPPAELAERVLAWAS